MTAPALNMTEEQRQARLLELEQAELAELRRLRKYETDNKIEFFGNLSAVSDGKPLDPWQRGPNPRQRELLDAWMDHLIKVFVYSGANRTGKTTIWVLIAISVMAGRWLWSNERLSFPHNKARKVRVVGQDWEKHIKTVVVPELHFWWPKNRPVTIKKNNVGADAMWKDELTGSTLEIMSNNQESALFEGWQGDLVCYDEPPRRKVRVACARGLIDRTGRELFGMTLLKEAWVQKEVINARTPDGKPDRTVFSTVADIMDNVGYGITMEGVKQFEKTLTEDEKDARLRGRPSYMSGLVLKKFERRKHLIERFPIPLNWIVDIAFDIHPRKEQCVIFLATSPRQDRYVCFELWQHGDGTQIAEAAVRIIARNKLRVGRVICDPLAKSDSNDERTDQNTTFNKIVKVLAQHDMVLEVGSKDKVSGILAINEHLEGPNKQPSLFFFDDLVKTISDAENWMYDDETQNPKKEDDDAMENLYRLLLLDTKWEEPYGYGEADDYREREVDETGY